MNKLILGNCLEVMKEIESQSIDLILCDLPYGVVDCKWDIIIPFDKLWEQYNRIIKDNSMIVLTASQPFTTLLINSNFNNYRYSLVWNKKLSGSFAVAKYRPLPIHEDIVVFKSNNHKKGITNYYPQMRKGKERTKGRSKNKGKDVSENYKGLGDGYTVVNDLYFPTSIIEIGNTDRRNSLHPTQKPLELMEYLIKTYSKEGDLVLDNCMGSGTTCLAAKNLGSNFIGIEKEEKYFDIAKKRLGID